MERGSISSFDAISRSLPVASFRASPLLRRLLVGVTGSIAAALMPNNLLWLRQHTQLESIKVILTPSANTMVARRAIAAITGGEVYVDQESADTPLHITLLQRADIFLIMPATANIIAKAAHGIADDLLTTSILGAMCPVVFAPCMNNRMWEKPTVRRNVESLRRDGYRVIDPVEGYSVASGSMEMGALQDMDVILPILSDLVESKSRVSAEQVGTFPAPKQI